MAKEFFKFLKEYKIVSVAIAFVLGEASSSLVSSLVKDVFLPLIAPLMQAESWKDASLQIGSIKISYGTFFADLLNFLILVFVIFILARKLLQMEKESK